MFQAMDDDGDLSEKFRKFFGPEHIDNSIREAIKTCWIILPDDKRNVDELEKQIRRIVDRALQDIRDDRKSFGFC